MLAMETIDTANPVVDTYLISQAEKYAAGRCHEAANLIQAYTYSVELYSQLRERKEESLAELREMVTRTERTLRSFLYHCRLLAIVI